MPDDASTIAGAPKPGPLAVPSTAAVVTGCSSGIGRAVAVALHEAGYPVYATARNAATLVELAEAGMTTLALDVTDQDSMAAAVAAVVADHGAVGVLVNNAGYALQGAVEQTPLDEVRRQFETNVFGLVALTQPVLPGMRPQPWARMPGSTSWVRATRPNTFVSNWRRTSSSGVCSTAPCSA